MQFRRLPAFLLRLLIVIAFSLPAFAQQSARIAPADILILRAKVYTVNPAMPWAQAVAIRRGKIVAVGSNEAVEKMRGIGTKVIDAGGKVVLPGFTDCHVHFFEGSLALGRVSLDGLTTVAEIQKTLREYAAQHPGDSWILGRGWNYAVFGEEALPNKKYLDELFPDRPVFLEGYDGHTYWVNSKALAMAGITKATPDPVNGFIVPRRSNRRANRRAERGCGCVGHQNNSAAQRSRKAQRVARGDEMGQQDWRDSRS